ncbi:hypothetical protein L1887_37907 [Cichorium endivia]|nr:hypothetical protein L1887_37907 [Cichorium endivia]
MVSGGSSKSKDLYIKKMGNHTFKIWCRLMRGAVVEQRRVENAKQETRSKEVEFRMSTCVSYVIDSI